MLKETLLESLRRFPGDSGTIQRLGHELETNAEWPLMLEVLEQQLPHVKSGTQAEAQVTYLMAKAAVELGHARRALALIGRSLLLRPDFAFSHHIKGRALSGMQRFAEAITAQQRCVQLAPNFCWGWFELGCLQRDQGTLAEAKQSLRRALGLQPARDGYHFRLIHGVLGEVDGQLRQQERQEAARSLWPDQPLPRLGERLSSLDEMELEMEQFDLFLSCLEPSPES